MFLDYTIFADLYDEAKGYTDIDLYVTERGWQSWMDNFQIEEVIKILHIIYPISKMTMADIRKAFGYSSRAVMSRKHKIPIRTLENWDKGDHNPPEYVISYIAYTLFVAEMHKDSEGEEKNDPSK